MAEKEQEQEQPKNFENEENGTDSQNEENAASASIRRNRPKLPERVTWRRSGIMRRKKKPGQPSNQIDRRSKKCTIL